MNAQENPIAKLLAELGGIDLAHLIVVGATTDGKVLSAVMLGDGPTVHLLGQLAMTSDDVVHAVKQRTIKEREFAQIAQQLEAAKKQEQGTASLFEEG